MEGLTRRFTCEGDQDYITIKRWGPQISVRVAMRARLDVVRSEHSRAASELTAGAREVFWLPCLSLSLSTAE